MIPSLVVLVVLVVVIIIIIKDLQLIHIVKELKTLLESHHKHTHKYKTPTQNTPQIIPITKHTQIQHQRQQTQ